MKHVGLDHVGVNVENLDAATEFFLDLGLEKEGATSIHGEWVGKIIGLENVYSDVVFLRSADGGSKIELVKFHTPADDQGPQSLAANRLGIRHLAFIVEDLDAVLDKLKAKGMNPVGTVHNYKDIFRLCYIRGPEGIIVELSERLGSATAS